MAAPKKPETFDEHVGSIVGGLARPHGGRPFLISLLDWSKGTVDRRILGSHGFTVKELQVVAQALHTTPEEITAQALKNYSKGSVEDGVRKLIEAENVTLVDDVSEAPASLDAQRQKKMPADMTDDELEGERSAANTDPEIGHDEPDTP